MGRNVSSSGVQKTKGFSGYVKDLEEKVFAFQRQEYPHRSPESIAPNWCWMLVESAFRLDSKPLVWLYLKDNAVVAHQGAIPVRLQVADDEVMTGWFVETMAAKSIRGSAIGPMLVKKALEDLPLNLSLGQTKQMRELQFALGWEQVCLLSRHLFVCGYRMNLRNKLPTHLAEFAAFALGLFHNLRWRWRRQAKGARISFAHIKRFNEEHDELWRQMASSCVCAVVRDASYLNWKYIDRPSNRFTCIEIRDGDKLLGISVVMVSEPNKTYDYRRGFLVDFVMPLDRVDVILALINESVRVLKSLKVQTVTCHITSEPVRAALKAFGFIDREPRHHFLVAVENNQTPFGRRLLQEHNWFLTLGDSDADAYAD